MEREREKERIRVSKELLEAKRIEEENERKRLLAFRKAEKEEERRAREKIRQKVEEDKCRLTNIMDMVEKRVSTMWHIFRNWTKEKYQIFDKRVNVGTYGHDHSDGNGLAQVGECRREKEGDRHVLQAERRRKLGLPPVDPDSAKPSTPVVEEKKSSLPVRPATKTDQMRDCLRSLKQNHKDDEAKVKTAFNTLLTYVKNAAVNPNEEKFRKIRLTNATFQARVGALKGGIEFLELCGFEKVEGGEFLFLPRDKVDMAVLSSAGTELNSAINNPFFGVL
ncbi:hypothetical protein C3L33_15190, partial [Rhododendron williamsianum]